MLDHLFRVYHGILFKFKRRFLQIKNAKDAYSIFDSYWRWKCDNEREYFLVLGIDDFYYLKSIRIHVIGNEDFAIVDTARLFHTLHKDDCWDFYIAHNHPGNNLESSWEDKDATNHFREVGESRGFNLLNHIIISERNFVIV